MFGNHLFRENPWNLGEQALAKPTSLSCSLKQRYMGGRRGDEGGKNKEGERKASKRQHLDEGLASSISTQTTKGPMEVEPHESNGSTAGIKDNGLHLYPVPLQASGQGLPYAPIDWPCPGDVCGWKVGRRVTGSGYHLDRYLYLPSRFSKKSFSSKVALEQHVRKEFPDTDIDNFFRSFSWRVLFKKASSTKDREEDCPREVAAQSRPDSQLETGGCKAGNRLCSSLALAARNTHLAMNCDICCTEPSFCRDCSCVLCCKSIASSYSFIKCEAPVSEGYICGHVAHMDCALRSYLAGTVGGSIGLDAEYHCRRCDMRTDLVSHVARLLKTCESVDSRDDIEKILGVGICILRGSRKASAKKLLNQLELAMTKLKSGTAVEDIWKAEVDTSALPAGSFHGKDALEVTNPQTTLDVHIISNQGSESQRLDDEIDKVLQALRKSQVSEYKIAEERLYAQKSHLLTLYKQLEEGRSQLSRGLSSASTSALLDAIVNTSDRIRQEVKKLRDMEKVAKGFGKTPKGILKEHFTLEVED